MIKAMGNFNLKFLIFSIKIFQDVEREFVN